jgi:hypothetical protein
MGIYIEALILYILLFLSGSVAQISGTTIYIAGFSATAGTIRVFLYTITSLALIWYFILRSKKHYLLSLRPGKKDLVSCFITFPGLLITGFIIAFLSSHTSTGETVQIVMNSPSNVTEWILLCTICILSAYLEESFFRFYILERRQELNLSAASALALSVVLFSICHIYEGPWGFTNAVISGAFLGFMYLRYNSLHGIAIAHGLYNISAYIINALVN